MCLKYYNRLELNKIVKYFKSSYIRKEHENMINKNSTKHILKHILLI